MLLPSLKSQAPDHESIPDLVHLGGEESVTGSCHLLRARRVHIMVDCGMAQGSDSVQRISEWEVKPRTIDYLFLTHAHIDHIGRLPELIAAGFRGQIICSHATKALIIPLLKDALSFQDYTEDQKRKLITSVQDLSLGFDYGHCSSLKNEIRFSLGRAGHILGSSFLWLQFPMENNRSWSVVFSGDLGNRNTPLLPDPDPPPACDLLILESTYGD
jgi:metallo-beta-lactamase family protein